MASSDCRKCGKVQNDSVWSGVQYCDVCRRGTCQDCGSIMGIGTSYVCGDQECIAVVRLGGGDHYDHSNPFKDLDG